MDDAVTRREGRAVLIAGGHPLFGTALRLALRAEGTDAHQIASTEPAAILATASLLSPGVTLLDLGWFAGGPGRGAEVPELVAALCARGSGAVVLSGADDELVTAAAVVAGAIGALDTATPFEALRDALTRAAEGRPLMTGDERIRWIEIHRRELARRVRVMRRLNRPSAREREILELLARASSDEEPGSSGDLRRRPTGEGTHRRAGGHLRALPRPPDEPEGGQAATRSLR